MSRRRLSAGPLRRRKLAGAARVPLLTFATLLAGTSLGYGAEQVPVRAGLHENFARLVFDWSAPVGYQVGATDRQLTVTFERPMAGRFDGARAAIDDYIGDVRLEDGGKRVVFDLKRRIEPSHFVNEKSVVIDLRPAGGVAAPAANVAQVPVRLSSRNGYTRIVFDWPVRTDYRLDEKDKRVTLTFERPGELALPTAGETASALIADIQNVRRDGGAAGVAFDVAGRVRHFRDGRKVVVDIFTEDSPPQNATAAADTPAAVSKPAAPQQPPAATAAPPAAPKPDALHTKVGAPVQLVPASQRAQPSAPAALPADAKTLAVALKVELDGVGLTFPFAEPTALAAFRRGGWIWLVFDRPFRIDTAPFAAAKEFVSAAEQLAHGEATILRLMTTPGFNATVAREGNKWEVVIAPQLMRPVTALQVAAHPGDDPSVTLGPTEPLTPVRISDPEIGDEFFAVTVAPSGHGVAQLHQFTDFQLLPSVQGVVVVPHADGLKVEPRAQEIVITAAGGLHLASAQERRRVSAASTEQSAAERMFDFAAWSHKQDGAYGAAQSHLLQQIEAAAPDARNGARIELARFYFTHGMGDRARGILQLVGDDSEDTARLATFRALRGAVNYTMGDFAAAAEDLLHRDLDSEPELELWRAALAAEEGRFDEATYGLRQSDRFVQSYPDALRKRFAFLGAETALANGDARGGEFWLAIAAGANFSEADRAYDQVLRANVAALDGEIETALKMYGAAIAGVDRRARARAVLEKTELLLREREITAEQAIEDLDRLRYVWRGDEIEFRVLRRLGELQIETGKFREGLQSLKRLVTNFADHRLAPDIAEYMRRTFAELYEGGTMETLPPVMAIALFNDFRELAPAGTKGDDMIRRLADRLVAVDLLPQAAELLAHQIEFRLQGEDRARIGARLAVIHLLNRDPGEALAAIAASHSDGVATELEQERALIAARAYAQLGAFDKALAALGTNASEAADRVRGDIMWQKHDWASAAAVFGRLVGDPPAAGKLLDDVRSRYVLNRAVALALSGDMAQLATLHRQFAGAMAASPYGADFQVIASVETGATDFQEALRRVSVVDDFQAFMEGYRARLAQSASAPKENLVN